jgi:L-aspartate oxidase
MWRHAGVLRERRALDRAVARLEGWVGALTRARTCGHQFSRVDSLATVGLLIARAALRREESRGGHFRADFPARDDLHWKKHMSDVLRT